MNIKDLEGMPLWVCWQTEPRGENDTKIPYSPHGGPAKSNDPKTWGTRQAEEARLGLPNPKGISGVGLVFAEVPGTGLKLGGVDFDVCLDEKMKATPWASEIVLRLKTYTEISPSANGLKSFFLFDPKKMEGLRGKTVRRRGASGGGKDPAIEFYLGGRYFAVTDRVLPAYPDLREVEREDLTWLLNQAIPAFSGKPKDKKNGEPKTIHIDVVASAFDIIPNEQLGWEDWNIRGLAIYAATDGSEEGFAIFDKWSRLSDNYSDLTTRERWEHYAGSPPDRSTIGSIIHWARAEDPDWVPPHSMAAGQFQRGDARKGKQLGPVIPNQGNYRLALAKLGVRLSFNEFSRQYIIEGPGEKPSRRLDDAEQDYLYLAIDEKWQFRSNKDFFFMFLKNEARQSPFHPVKEYLDGLVWDGKERVDTWLIRLGGVDDSAYARAVSRLFLVAAVKRIRDPGCKFDEMLVLESKQGFDKSTALEALAVRKDWFSDSLPLNVDERKVIETVEGKWIMEIAELKGIRQGEIEHLKAFLSRTTDRARKAYDRDSSHVPRQFVVAGSTNSAAYLLDTTGNRRFWPLKTGRFLTDQLLLERDQLWAEAAAIEASGESIRLDPSLYDDAAAQQDERVVDEPWVPAIETALNGYNSGKILSAHVWELTGVMVAMRTQTHSSRLGATMQALGWERTKLRDDEGRVKWHYAKGSAEERKRRISVTRDEHGFPVVEAEGDREADTHAGPPVDDDIPFPE